MIDIIVITAFIGAVVGFLLLAIRTLRNDTLENGITEQNRNHFSFSSHRPGLWIGTARSSGIPESLLCD